MFYTQISIDSTFPLWSLVYKAPFLLLLSTRDLGAQYDTRYTQIVNGKVLGMTQVKLICKGRCLTILQEKAIY